MSKKAYYKCEGCGLSFPADSLVMNNELELTCEECLEEAKRDKRSNNLLFSACALIAFAVACLIFKHCSK